MTFAVNGDVASGFALTAVDRSRKCASKDSLGDLAATMMACDDAQMSLEDSICARCGFPHTRFSPVVWR
jgi:hypothetical protein